MNPLVDSLNYREKVDRSLDLIRAAVQQHGDRVRVANSLGKDSAVVWHLANRVDPNIRGFIIVTKFKFAETLQFAEKIKSDRLVIYRNDEDTDPSNTQDCCHRLKVVPLRRALEGCPCWITGLRCTEGHTRMDMVEVENGKLNPILLWTEREVWQYIALHQIEVNPLYHLGYRSLGCEPCTRVVPSGGSERDGRWFGIQGKSGGECGIHSCSKETNQ